MISFNSQIWSSLPLIWALAFSLECKVSPCMEEQEGNIVRGIERRKEWPQLSSFRGKFGGKISPSKQISCYVENRRKTSIDILPHTYVQYIIWSISQFIRSIHLIKNPHTCLLFLTLIEQYVIYKKWRNYP